MNETPRVIVVDDETIIAEFLKTVLEKCGCQVKMFFSADIEFDKYLLEFKPDVVFLDINLNSEKSGIDLGRMCNEKDIPFIYLTSYSDQKTIESALAYKPVSYVLKPFTEKDILVNLELAKMKTKRNNENEVLVLRDGYDTIRVDISKIKWLKADNVYTEVVTTEKKYLQRASLSEVHQSLPQEIFLRVHRSFVVNINEISRVASDYIELGKERIPLSRTKKSEVLKRFSA